MEIVIPKSALARFALGGIPILDLLRECSIEALLDDLFAEIHDYINDFYGDTDSPATTLDIHWFLRANMEEAGVPKESIDISGRRGNNHYHMTIYYMDKVSGDFYRYQEKIRLTENFLG